MDMNLASLAGNLRAPKRKSENKWPSYHAKPRRERVYRLVSVLSAVLLSVGL